MRDTISRQDLLDKVMGLYNSALLANIDNDVDVSDESAILEDVIDLIEKEPAVHCYDYDEGFDGGLIV